MILLNLLSPQKKKETQEKILYFLIKNTLMVFIAFIIFVAIILLSAKLILTYNFQKVLIQTTLIVKEYGGMNNKIREMNQKLESIRKTQETFIAWSEIIRQINGLIPENIKINAMVFDKEKEKTYLKGVAKTRDDLLKLKTNLDGSEIFEFVELPFTNLLNRVDIDFEFKLTIKIPKY